MGDVNANVNINGLNDIDANVTANADIDATLNAAVDADLNADIDADANLTGNLTADVGLDNIRAELVASLRELAPLFFNFLWREIPIVRIGFPHRYRLGFSVCGKELFALTFCGESELITENNRCADEEKRRG